MNMQQLIRTIIEGHTSFGPSSDSETSLRDFQLVATLILKAEELGYASDVVPHRESDSGNDYYDAVVVGSVTKRGREIAR